MSTYRVEPDRQRIIFPTEVNPFVFKDSTELVQKILEEANMKTEKERKIILKSQKIFASGFYVCWIMLAFMSIIGIPFMMCYLCSKVKEIGKASEKVVYIWEEIAKSNNPKLIEKGIFIRFVTNYTSIPRKNGGIYNCHGYFYEFSFGASNMNDPIHLNVGQSNNLKDSQMAPPQIIQVLANKN